VGSRNLALAALLAGNDPGIHLRRMGNPQEFGEENFFPPLGIKFRTHPVPLFTFRHYKYRVICLNISYYS
jgi:hypothetical protein